MNSELNFCTLFDSNYLTRGLALYESLMTHEPAAFLYVLSFDELSTDVLKKINLPRMRVITLDEFEDALLIRIKPTRSPGEYCWTCTPSLVRYCLEQFNLASCTYLDADMFFFSSPRNLLEEMPSSTSVSVSEHRYTPMFDQSLVSGIYCVQFMTFKHTDAGLRIVNWWRDRCIEWCFNKAEDGKFGDQKYLDDWPERFKGDVHVIKNIGCGVAPWNVGNTRLLSNERLCVTDHLYKRQNDIVFFHFHGLKFYKKFILLSEYPMNKDWLDRVYQPYILALQQQTFRLKEFSHDFNGSRKQNFLVNVKVYLRSYLRSSPIIIKRFF